MSEKKFEPPPASLPADDSERTVMLKKMLVDQGQSLEIVEDLDEETLEKLTKVFQQSFPANMLAEPEVYRERFRHLSTGVLAVLKDNKKDNEIVGLVVAEPHDSLIREMSTIDPDFKEDPTALYADTMAIVPGQRSFAGFMNLENTLVEGAIKKGYKKITTYARVANKMSDVLQRRFGYQLVRKIKNWADTGEDFDFLEKDLDIAASDKENN